MRFPADRLVSALVALAFVVLGIASFAPPAPAQQLTVIRLGATPDDDLTSVLWAEKSGMFRKVGIDVQLTKMRSGAAIAAAVAGGSLDGGKSSLPNLIAAHVRNVPLVIFAPAGIADASAPYDGLIVRSDSPIRTGKDLNGKLISIPALKDMNQVVTSAWVDQHGGDSKTLRFVELPMTAAPAALEEKRVDAAVVIYPPLAAAVQSGKVRILGDAYGAVSPKFLMSGWFTTKEWAAKHADLIKTFNRVVLESAQYVNTHHAQTAPVVAEFNGVPLATIEHMTRGIAATSLDGSLIQPMIDASVKYGIIPRGFPASELVDPVALTK